MGTKRSAAASALGYLYQARLALYLLLDAPEETELRLESLDDIEFYFDCDRFPSGEVGGRVVPGGAEPVVYAGFDCAAEDLADRLPDFGRGRRAVTKQL